MPIRKKRKKKQCGYLSERESKDAMPCTTAFGSLRLLADSRQCDRLRPCLLCIHCAPNGVLARLGSSLEPRPANSPTKCRGESGDAGSGRDWAHRNITLVVGGLLELRRPLPSEAALVAHGRTEAPLEGPRVMAELCAPRTCNATRA